ncbi:MAG: serine/threonine-protein kinase, partial [Planctomycetota bacterium]
MPGDETVELRRRALALFDELCDRDSAVLPGLLDERCGSETELRSMVERMLGVDRSRASMIRDGDGAAAIVPGIVASERANAPVRVGSFRVLGELGSGGMGIVYEAEQDRPKRSVALKLLRGGGARDRLARRFEREAELLARLHHNGIAQVFEAGSATVETSEGGSYDAPYFAMELVRGQPIDRYCDEHGLGRRERLSLIARVCDAVQHAHDMGVLHRDLKPDNIFVDAGGNPKVLDFGVARLTDADIQSATMQTEVGQLIGTAAYMSPEQFAGETGTLDGRTDVYALGVVLYELLADRLPFDVSGKPIVEIARMVQNDEPRPLTTVDRSMRGDVETLVLTALDRDQSRRYQSPSMLAADIRRHLADEPLVARPPSTFYQLGKFAKRNRTLVGGVAASFVLLIAGIIGTSVALASALAAQSELEESNRTLRRTSLFQALVFEDLSPRRFGNAITEDISAEFREGLDRAGIPEAEAVRQTEEFDHMLGVVNGVNVARGVLRSAIGEWAANTASRRFEDDPTIAAQIHNGIGQMYSKIGLRDDAIDQFRLSYDMFMEHLGPDSWQTVQTAADLGRAYLTAGRPDLAEPLLDDAIEGYARARNPPISNVFLWRNALGMVYMQTGRQELAEDVFRSILDARGQTRAPGPRAVRNAWVNVAALLMERGEYERAIEIFEESRDEYKATRGRPDALLLKIENNIMVALFRLGRIDEAEPAARALVELNEERSGSGSPPTIRAMNNLGRILLDTGQLEEAYETLAVAHERAIVTIPATAEIRLTSTANLIDALTMLGRHAEALPLAEGLLVDRRAVRPANEFQVSQTLEQLGICLIELGRDAEAAAYLNECVAIREGINADHWLSHWARHMRGVAESRAGGVTPNSAFRKPRKCSGRTGSSQPSFVAASAAVKLASV